MKKCSGWWCAILGLSRCSDLVVVPCGPVKIWLILSVPNWVKLLRVTQILFCILIMVGVLASRRGTLVTAWVPVAMPLFAALLLWAVVRIRWLLLQCSDSESLLTPGLVANGKVVLGVRPRKSWTCVMKLVILRVVNVPLSDSTGWVRCIPLNFLVGTVLIWVAGSLGVVRLGNVRLSVCR